MTDLKCIKSVVTVPWPIVYSMPVIVQFGAIKSGRPRNRTSHPSGGPRHNPINDVLGTRSRRLVIIAWFSSLYRPWTTDRVRPLTRPPDQ